MYVSLESFLGAVKHGCCVCGDAINEKDHEKTGWSYTNEPVCKSCLTLPENEEFLIN